jgi:hypothetical protein
MAPKSAQGGGRVRAYGLRLPVVLTALVLALAALFGLQQVYAQQSVAAPLITRLERVAGVQGTPQVSRSGTNLNIRVQLGLVPNLNQTYKTLLGIADQNANGRTVTLEISDHRTPALVADYNQLMFALDQARATGAFSTMAQQFQQDTKSMHLQAATVTLSQTQMFVTLVQGKHYLYAVMPLLLTGSGGGSTG